MLEILNVSKTFNKGTINEKKALNKLSLHLNPGDFVTIIGGNGAGKSTLIKGILGLQNKLAGEILIMGEPIKKVQKKIAYIPRLKNG